MDGPYLRTSLWMAFYASAPLCLYDFIMVGVIGGEGLHFLVSHWYISLAYLYVWVEIPLIALALQKLHDRMRVKVGLD